MCGINGILKRQGVVGETDFANVDRMNSALAHRGPDDSGICRFDRGVIGMRRLSVVGLSSGHQPMQTEDGRWTIVFNGEIYDYQLRRQELARRGFRFSTQSDTEVLLACIAMDGIDCVASLNGMFAFAAADHHTGKVYLARDRWGVKPLYYYYNAAGSLYFSSELHSLTSNPEVPRRIDLASLEMLLVDRFVADPWTLFSDVRQLPPAQLIEWSSDGCEVKPYEFRKLEPFGGDEREALQELKSRLSASVRSQLIADVPVGVFLSGGIDSTTVAAFAAQQHDGRLKTFTVGFPSGDHDETETARDVARHLATDHTEIRMAEVPYDEKYLRIIVRHVGQPLGDPSCIPTLLISQAAGREMKAILSGDGGDEFFGGYDHIRWAARISRFSKLPLSGSAVPFLRGLELAVPRRFAKITTRLRRYRRGAILASQPPPEQLRHVMSLWSPAAAQALMGENSELRSTYAQWYSASCASVEEALMRQLAHTYMPGAILTKVDRMSMANSLEVRVPLLDNRITEFALSLPLDLKVRGKRGKYLLRQAGRSLLPESVYSRPKQGFSLPLADWLDTRFWDLLRDYSTPGSLLSEVFDPQVLAGSIGEARSVILEGHRSALSKANLACRMWVLAQIAVWRDQFQVSV